MAVLYIGEKPYGPVITFAGDGGGIVQGMSLTDVVGPLSPLTNGEISSVINVVPGDEYTVTVSMTWAATPMAGNRRLFIVTDTPAYDDEMIHWDSGNVLQDTLDGGGTLYEALTISTTQTITVPVGHPKFYIGEGTTSSGGGSLTGFPVTIYNEGELTIGGGAGGPLVGAVGIGP